MLSRRIIPCLDVRDGRVVKGVRFRDHVDMGDITELALRYRDAGADEQQQAQYDIKRLVQREMGNPLDHWAACFSGLAAGLKYLSRCRLPSTTTLLPSATPLVMSIRPSRSAPASTACLR